MTDQPTPPRGPYADIAPALDDLTQRVLFDEVWERPGLIARPTPVGRANTNDRLDGGAGEGIHHGLVLRRRSC